MLIAHWPLNGALDDVSGRGNHIVNGTATYVDNGKIGKALDSNNSTGLVVPLNDDLRSVFRGTEFTISLWWHQYTTPTDWADIIDYIDTRGISRRLEIGHASANPIYSTFWNNIGKGDITYASSIYSNYQIEEIGKFFHLTFRRTANSFDTFLNGALLDSRTPVNSEINEINTDLRLASYNNSNSYLNDIRLYNNALSDKEIKEISKAKILHYDFNDMQEPTENYFKGESYGNHETGNGTYIRDCQEVVYDSNYEVIKIKADVVGDEYGLLPWKIDEHLDTSGGIEYTWSANIMLTEGSYVKLYNHWNPWTAGEEEHIEKNVWKRISFTITSTADGRHDFGLQIFTDGCVYATMPQFEKKAYSTDFVGYGKTRTGRITDISGFQNHAILDTTTTPRWTSDSKLGGGAYEFFEGQHIQTNQLFFDADTQCWTSCGWVSLANLDTSQYQYFDNFNLGNRIIHSGARPLLYANGGVNDHYVYGSQIKTINTWMHMAFVYDRSNTRCQIYINGELDRSSSNYTESDLAVGFNSYTRFFENFSGKSDDVRIYATALSDDDIKELYESRANLDDHSTLCVNKLSSHGLGATKRNEIPYENWEVGDYSSAGFNFGNDYSCSVSKYTGHTTAVQVEKNPVGEDDAILMFRCDVEQLNKYGHPSTYYNFPSDSTKTYRWTQWIYLNNEDGNSSNRHYLGAKNGAQQFCSVNTTSINDNFYFNSPQLDDTNYSGRWVLQEFYIFPYGSTGNQTYGELHYTDGTSTHYGSNCNWADVPLKDQSNIRQYMMYQYDTLHVGSYIKTYRPRLEIIDGNEPSIETLLKCREHRPIISESEIVENGTLCAKDISEVGITDGMVGYWKFDNKLRGFCETSVGSAVLNGTATISSDGVETKVVLEESSRVVYNDVHNEIMVYGQELTESYTISLMAYPHSASQTQEAIVFAKTGNHTGLVIQENKWNFRFPMSGGLTYCYSTNPIVANKWTHVVCTYNKGEVKIYIDGDLNNTLQTSGNYRFGTSNPFTTGYDGTTTTKYKYDGKVKEAKTFNMAFSDKEAMLEYKSIMKISNMEITNDKVYIKNIKEGY